jgi:hypothetical protein
MRASSANQTSNAVGSTFSRARSRPDGLESVFKIVNGAVSLGVMARTRRQLAIPHRAHLAAYGLLGHRDPELLEHPLTQIDDAPANDAVRTIARSRLGIAGIGPLSIIAAIAARCVSLSREDCPGALRSSRPSGPQALNFITQSHTI